MMRGRRQRGQVMVIAVVATVSMLGALSLVIDAGLYFVIKRQLQNAADAAALAAVWYDPACPGSTWSDYGCQTAGGPTAPECNVPPNNLSGNALPCTAAVNQVKANSSVALSLCAGPILPTGAIAVDISAHPGVGPPNSDPNLVVPNVTPYVVTVSCNAPHWFARVLPGVNLTMEINANAAAALGWRGDNGQLFGGPPPSPPSPPPPPLVARLIR
jgi:hypothetical protein